MLYLKTIRHMLKQMFQDKENNKSKQQEGVEENRHPTKCRPKLAPSEAPVKRSSGSMMKCGWSKMCILRNTWTAPQICEHWSSQTDWPQKPSILRPIDAFCVCVEYSGVGMKSMTWSPTKWTERPCSPSSCVLARYTARCFGHGQRWELMSP